MQAKKLESKFLYAHEALLRKNQHNWTLIYKNLKLATVKQYLQKLQELKKVAFSNITLETVSESV